MPQAMERLLATPMIRPRLPAIKPSAMSLPSLIVYRFWHGARRAASSGLAEAWAGDYGPAMMFKPDDILRMLILRMGEAAVITEASRMAAFLNEPRKRFHKKALAVVVPESIEAVQAVANFCNVLGIGLIPQGGNTGLVGAQVPLYGSEIIVSLTKLNKVRHIDAAAGVMTAEAGLTLQEAHQAAEAAGAIFPLWIGSQGSARIGGVLSSNAGGVQVLAYGNARELCLGIEAVLADGRLYRGLNALKKDNTGYDL